MTEEELAMMMKIKKGENRKKKSNKRLRVK